MVRRTFFALLVLLLLNGAAWATSSAPFDAVMMDSNGLAGVTAVGIPFITAPRMNGTGVTGYSIDWTSGSAWMVDLSGATNLGNDITGVSIQFTSYVTEYPIRGWIAVKQNSGNTCGIIWTGVSMHALPSGVSPSAPDGARDISIYEIWCGIEGERGASGTTVYPISGVTIDN